jgi:hypothetical protein
MLRDGRGKRWVELEIRDRKTARRFVLPSATGPTFRLLFYHEDSDLVDSRLGEGPYSHSL